MDNRTFVSRLAKLTGNSVRQTNNLSDTLVALIKDSLCTQDTVAVPGFGSFSAVKKDEEVVTDKNGNRMLMPPSINAEFMVGSRLKKSLAK